MSKIQDLIRGGSSDEDIIKECGCSPEQLLWFRYSTTIADSHRLLKMQNALKLRERLEIAIQRGDSNAELGSLARHFCRVQKTTETSLLDEATKHLGVCP